MKEEVNSLGHILQVKHMIAKFMIEVTREKLLIEYRKSSVLNLLSGCQEVRNYSSISHLMIVRWVMSRRQAKMLWQNK
jgi:hypothetical protein